MRDGFGSDAATFEVQELEIQDEAFRLDIVSPSVAAEVRRGDVIEAGVQRRARLHGGTRDDRHGFRRSLVCSNGMVHRECLGSRRTARTRRLDADREDAGIVQTEQVRRMTAEIRQALEPKLAAIGRLAEERADTGQLGQFLRQARMHSRGLVDQLRQSWGRGECRKSLLGHRVADADDRVAPPGGPALQRDIEPVLQPATPKARTAGRGSCARRPGTRSGQAAARPMIPAFELWVWTTSGLSRRIDRRSRR